MEPLLICKPRSRHASGVCPRWLSNRQLILKLSICDSPCLRHLTRISHACESTLWLEHTLCASVNHGLNSQTMAQPPSTNTSICDRQWILAHSGTIIKLNSTLATSPVRKRAWTGMQTDSVAIWYFSSLQVPSAINRTALSDPLAQVGQVVRFAGKQKGLVRGDRRASCSIRKFDEQREQDRRPQSRR